MSENAEQKQEDHPSIEDRLAGLEKAEQLRSEAADRLGRMMVHLRLVTEAEIEAEGFDPSLAATALLGDLVAERNSLKRSLTAQKGATTRAKNAVVQLAEAKEPRKLGPLKKQAETAVADLFELLSQADAVEIAFSNGKDELRAVPPVQVSGEAFTFRRGRIGLDVADLSLRGPIDGKGPRSLAGYALLIDGEQVAWAPRLAGQLNMAGGTTYQVKDDIVLT